MFDPLHKRHNNVLLIEQVILESLQDLERADSFARCVDNTHVWEKVGR